MYASASAIAEQAAEAVRAGRKSLLADVLPEKGRIDAGDVNAARKAGDELAAEVWDNAVRHLAIGCVSVQRLFDCDLLLLAGGLTKAGDDLLGPLKTYYAELDWRMTEPLARLAIGDLGNEAGVMGAAGVAWQVFTLGEQAIVRHYLP